MTGSYLKGEHTGLGAFGYNRDGKRGKLQIVTGLLTDVQGEPPAVRVFEGNREGRRLQDCRGPIEYLLPLRLASRIDLLPAERKHLQIDTRQSRPGHPELLRRAVREVDDAPLMAKIAAVCDPHDH